ncbi:hypothetical protein G6F51_013102 [Rhizopus arrhizus]|uniref:Uncharacterized protein n=1 Tax=Rhizopus oryzae TaxID=64495 RepID=A0A9P6XUI9_RHIOR|nr:hypothetical protein G6F51_013102 [Rhizopus arrhizus]
MDKASGTETKHATESKVRRKTSLSTSTRKRTRIKSADVHWCIDNVANLSVQTFAITFKHYDRQHCHSRYNIMLDSHIPEEHRSRLQDEFETWRKTIHCIEFWRNQRRAQALAEANDNCSEAANNLLISNVQEIKSSVEKYHVPEPSPVTMTLQAPTTPVGHPGTSVPPVLATTGTPVSQSLSPSMADTLVPTPSKDKLDSSAPAPATTSTADIQDHWIIGPVTAKFRQYQCMADMPTPCSGFTPTDFMTIVDVVSAIDAKTMSPKQARLQLLTLASSMNDLRANVIECIADM